MRQGQLWRGMALGLLVLAALAMGWTSPEAAGDLRPSPDAVEYGMAAVALARLQPPEVRVAGIAVPPRYPFGFPLLATPFVRWAAQGGEPQPHAAVLASAAAGAVVVGCLAVAGWQAFGAATAMVAVALVLVSPFYGTYARLVMAEMPTAALFGAMAAVVALSAGQPSPQGRWWGAGLGLLMAAAVSVRLGNVQAVPAVAAGLWCAVPQRRAGALTSLVIALAIGTMPLLAYNATTYGSPLTTGYHLWTPEWMEGGRQQFALRYALDSPALPAGAVQGNVPHYVAAWIGWPAAGDGGQAVGSPVHPTLAGALAVGAGLTLWRGLSFRLHHARKKLKTGKSETSSLTGTTGTGAKSTPNRAAVAVVSFTGVGVLTAFVFYAGYSYQDVRFLVPWVPLWLLLAAAGLTETMRGTIRCGLVGAWRPRGADAVASPWPAVGRQLAAAGAGVVLVAAFAGGAGAVTSAPLWQRAAQGQAPGASARLSQSRALNQELPGDAWIISAIDGPLLEHHVLRGTARRYIPLARGLEFVDKAPLRAVPTAAELKPAIAARLVRAHPTAGAPGDGGRTAAAVVIDRWSLEFAESLPDFRRALDEVLAGADLAPGGAGAPFRPAFYVLTPRAPGGVVDRFAVREGEALRDSAGRVFLFREGSRSHVPSITAFAALNLPWEAVRRLPDVVLEAIPQGPPVNVTR